MATQRRRHNLDPATMANATALKDVSPRLKLSVEISVSRREQQANAVVAVSFGRALYRPALILVDAVIAGDSMRCGRLDSPTPRGHYRETHTATVVRQCDGLQRGPIPSLRPPSGELYWNVCELLIQGNDAQPCRAAESITAASNWTCSNILE